MSDSISYGESPSELIQPSYWLEDKTIAVYQFGKKGDLLVGFNQELKYEEWQLVPAYLRWKNGGYLFNFRSNFSYVLCLAVAQFIFVAMPEMFRYSDIRTLSSASVSMTSIFGDYYGFVVLTSFLFCGVSVLIYLALYTERERIFNSIDEIICR